jgi:hypothetical protein
MATTPTYEAANGLSLRGPTATKAESKKRLRHYEGALADAIRAYDESTCKSRAVTATAFFVTAALAVAMLESTVTPMLGLLGLSMLNAALTEPLARLQFRLEIQRRARAEGFSPSTARIIASDMLGDWSSSARGSVVSANAET